MAVSSAELYASRLHLAADITTPAPHHSFWQAGCSSWCPTMS